MYRLFTLMGHAAAWKLWLAATAQHHKKVSYHTSLAWEKIKIQSMVSIECISLSHYCKVEKKVS